MRFNSYYYLAKFPLPKPAILKPVINGDIYVECRTIQNVVSSAAEAETGQRGIPIKIALGEMGHPQPSTPIKTNNTTALRYIERNIRQKHSKSWDTKLIGYATATY